MHGERGVAFLREKACQRRHLAAHILLIRYAAIGQEGVGKAGQRLEFDIGGHAAELRREDVTRLHGARERQRIGCDGHAGKPGRIPEGFAHHHDDVGSARRCIGRRRRRLDRSHRGRAVACRRAHIGHRHVEGKRHDKAVVTVICGLVPHHRFDIERRAQRRMTRIVHLHGKKDEKRHGQGQPHDPAHAARCRKHARLEPHDRQRYGGRGEGSNDQRPGRGAFRHHERQQFHDLARIQEIGRIGRIAEIELLLRTDPRKNKQHGSQQQNRLTLSPCEGVEPKQGKGYRRDCRERRSCRICEETEGLARRAAQDRLHQEGQRDSRGDDCRRIG